jgi:hypothetical protein
MIGSTAQRELLEAACAMVHAGEARSLGEAVPGDDQAEAEACVRDSDDLGRALASGSGSVSVPARIVLGLFLYLSDYMEDAIQWADAERIKRAGHTLPSLVALAASPALR